MSEMDENTEEDSQNYSEFSKPEINVKYSRGMNPASKRNLALFEKGNKIATGRPKGCVSLVTVLKNLLEKKISYKDPLDNQRGIKEVKEFVAAALLKKAIKGDVFAIKEVMDRVDGKVVQETKVQSTNINNHDFKMSSNEINDRISQILESK